MEALTHGLADNYRWGEEGGGGGEWGGEDGMMKGERDGGRRKRGEVSERCEALMPTCGVTANVGGVSERGVAVVQAGGGGAKGGGTVGRWCSGCVQSNGGGGHDELDGFLSQ